MSPKVSVIIPMYNAQKYIEECIASVQRQTLESLEIIVIDDYSGDESSQIVNRISQSDKRIKLIQNTENQGAGLCRNTGMDNACGACIYFIDADDWIEPQTLETAYKALIEHGADFVEFGIQRVGENGVKQVFYSEPFHVITDRAQWIRGYTKTQYADRIFRMENTDEAQNSGHENHQYTERIWNKLFHYQFLQRNQIRFKKAVLIEDHLFILNICQKIEKAVVIPDVLYNYRLHSESLTLGQATSGKIKGYVKLLAETKAFLEEEGLLASKTGKLLLNDRIGVSALWIWRYMDQHSAKAADELLLCATQETFGEGYYWIYTFIRHMAHIYRNMAAYFLGEAVQDKAQIVLYGAGDIGRNLHRVLTGQGVKVIAFVDTNPDTWGTQFCGVDVMPPQALKGLAFTKILIAASNYEPICDKLESMGYRRYQDFQYYPVGF